MDNISDELCNEDLLDYLISLRNQSWETDQKNQLLDDVLAELGKHIDKWQQELEKTSIRLSRLLSSDILQQLIQHEMSEYSIDTKTVRNVFPFLSPYTQLETIEKAYHKLLSVIPVEINLKNHQAVINAAKALGFSSAHDDDLLELYKKQFLADWEQVACHESDHLKVLIASNFLKENINQGLSFHKLIFPSEFTYPPLDLNSQNSKYLERIISFIENNS